jgi:hypothetical protein
VIGTKIVTEDADQEVVRRVADVPEAVLLDTDLHAAMNQSVLPVATAKKKTKMI